MYALWRDRGQMVDLEGRAKRKGLSAVVVGVSAKVVQALPRGAVVMRMLKIVYLSKISSAGRSHHFSIMPLLHLL